MLRLKTFLTTVLFTLLITSCEKEIQLNTINDDNQQSVYLESQDSDTNNDYTDKNNGFGEDALKTLTRPLVPDNSTGLLNANLPECISNIIIENGPPYYILYGALSGNHLGLEAVQGNRNVSSFDWEAEVYLSGPANPTGPIGPSGSGSNNPSPIIETSESAELTLDFNVAWFADISLIVTYQNGDTQTTYFRAIVNGENIVLENANISNEWPYTTCPSYCTDDDCPQFGGSTFTCVLP